MQVYNAMLISLADPGGGGRTRRPPPLTAADIWFFMHKTLNFLNIFFARDTF